MRTKWGETPTTEGVCVCITEPLGCLGETNTTLSRNYTPIKLKKTKEKMQPGPNRTERITGTSVPYSSDGPLHCSWPQALSSRGPLRGLALLTLWLPIPSSLTVMGLWPLIQKRRVAPGATLSGSGLRLFAHEAWLSLIHADSPAEKGGLVMSSYILERQRQAFWWRTGTVCHGWTAKFKG